MIKRHCNFLGKSRKSYAKIGWILENLGICFVILSQKMANLGSKIKFWNFSEVNLSKNGNDVCNWLLHFVLIINEWRSSIFVQLNIAWLYAKLPTVITPSLIDSFNGLYMYILNLKTSDPISKNLTWSYLINHHSMIILRVARRELSNPKILCNIEQIRNKVNPIK